MARLASSQHPTSSNGAGGDAELKLLVAHIFPSTEKNWRRKNGEKGRRETGEEKPKSNNE